MLSCKDLLATLSAGGFSVDLGQFSLTGLPQPSWVHSDQIEVLINYHPDGILVDVKFYHLNSLLKYGSDSETLLGMKRTCAEEWFPELEHHFQRVAEYYGLQWNKFQELEDDVAPVIFYNLSGGFPAEQSDRVFACLLEIRSILSIDSE